jgi:hypothetical protein
VTRVIVAALIGVATLSGCSHPKCDDVEDIQIMVRWLEHQKLNHLNNPGAFEADQEELDKQYNRLYEAKEDCKKNG